MSEWQRISVEQAKLMIDQQSVNLVDIRDPQSFTSGHIDGALMLDNNTVQSFIENAPSETPVIVYCYHGNSSQGAAAYLAEQGFAEVYSMDGGYELWRSRFGA